MQFQIKLGISARHLHVTQEHLEILFGPGAQLTPMKYLVQPGQFAAEEKVTLITPKGNLPNLRIIGPVRPQTQVELAIADARKIGLNPPIRNSGDLTGSSPVTIVGPQGQIEISEGVIIAARHLHLAPETAEKYGIKDKDIVKLKFPGERALIFENVFTRVSTACADEIHIDTDEGNACCTENDMLITVIKE